jgi:hypothetical protein
VAEAKPVLVILLDANAHGATPDELFGLVARRHPGAEVILLTTPEAAPRFSGLGVTVWTDGLARGPVRFLALVRRISWAHIGHIYDLEMSALTRFMRFCVWPMPQWHGPEALRTAPPQAKPVS